MWQQFKTTPVALVLIFSLATFAAQGQVPGSAQPVPHSTADLPPSAVLRQALSEVQNTTANLDISRWKAPGGVRSAAQEDVDSIQRALSQTLPGLLGPADATPESVPPLFAVYRNVDALYDVLLRVSDVANLAAPSDDADAITTSLQELQSARARLGDAILRVSQQHEAQIREFETTMRTAKAEQPAAKKGTIIVDDGPVTTSSARRKAEQKEAQRKHEEKHTLAKPAPGTPEPAPQ